MVKEVTVSAPSKIDQSELLQVVPAIAITKESRRADANKFIT